jgi:nitroreductase
MVSACQNQHFIADAPLIVVACGHTGAHLDVAIAFTHLILAARAEGLGTCWIGAFDNNEIKNLLKVPSDHEIVAATPLGYPSKANVFIDSK